MKDKCINCGFYDKAFGNCHALPPSVHSAKRQERWPPVEETDWCGDYIPDGNCVVGDNVVLHAD